MNSKNDIRAGYRVPDGYFEDFATRMAVMAANQKPVRRRPVLRPLIVAASAVAASLLLLVGIFNVVSVDADELLAEATSEDIVTKYLGATETDVVDYYLTEKSGSESISEEDVLEYLSTSGTYNLYAIMDL